MELSEETLSKIEDLIPKYPEKRSAALMVIHLVQDELGAISDDACSWIAEKLEVEPINIKELITFYPMLRETPWGKNMCESVGLYPVLFAVLMEPVKFWKKNWVSRKGMFGKMVNSQLNLWNVLQIVEKDP